MDKEILAEQLRDLHIELFVEHVMEMDDDEIIEHFITCDDCGKYLVTENQMEKIMDKAEDAGEFLDVCWDEHEKNYNAYKFN